MGDVVSLDSKRSGNYQLILEFDSDDPEFTRGVEAGRVYEALFPHKQASMAFTVHATNRTMMKRIAQAAGYRACIVHEDPDWIHYEFVWESL